MENFSHDARRRLFDGGSFLAPVEVVQIVVTNRPPLKKIKITLRFFIFIEAFFYFQNNNNRNQ
jgi:hypothetical protein